VRLRLLPLALLGVAACGNALAPLPSEGPPRLLRYRTFGFVPTLLDVRLDGEAVVLTSQPEGGGVPPTVTRRVPSAAEWQTFWRAVDAAGVRRWRRTCRAVGIETSGFEYELAWADARRAGSYTNAWPTVAGGCSVNGGVAADVFRAAVLTIAVGPRPADARGPTPAP
jgi:hypothetical protein